jgi:transmembrane sensor
MRDRHHFSGQIQAEALARYAAGESDRAERALVEAWAAASAERQEYLAALQRVWMRSRAGMSSAELSETDAAWVALRARLAQVDSPRRAGEGGDGADAVGSFGRSTIHPGRANVRRRAFVLPATPRAGRRQPWLRAAAAVLLLAVGVGALRHFLSDRRGAPVLTANQSPMREVVTGVGERARIRLGDGSTIVLAARSRLGIPADFGVRAREVETEGEAYFQVVHDSTLPFIVHTRGVRTADMGTAFVGRAYP